MTQDPRLPWGGRYVGRDGVIEFGLKLATTVDTSVATEQLFAAGDSVVQVGRSRGSIRATGATCDIPECHVWTFRNDLVIGVQFFIESDTNLDLVGR